MEGEKDGINEGCRRKETESGGRRGYIPELCCASAGVRQSSSWAKISSVFRSERCPCSPPLQHFPLSSYVVSPALGCPTLVCFTRCGLTPGAKRTVRAQTEQLVSFCPKRPPSHFSFPPTRPYQKRCGAQPKKNENHSYSTHCTLTVNQFPPLKNVFHKGET